MMPDFTLKLILWNETENKRVMPWKYEKDPYKIWLSEVILQQTRVEQGWDYYNRFVQQFPTIKHLAAADDVVIYKLWEGLGYYTRCKNLIDTARTIANEMDGTFPCTYHDILRLKGIGPYTAAAIASFAFNEPYAVVDGNVQRVIARYFGISTPIDTVSGKKMYAELAEALLDREQPGTYNQAIMDFGATVCKPQQPLCSICVQQADCEAYKHGFVKDLPVKQKALQKKHRWFNYYIIESNEGVLIRQRIEKDIWNQLHEFVLLETSKDTVEDEHQRFLESLLKGQQFTIEHTSSIIRQQLTHQVIHGRFITVKLHKNLDLLPGYEVVRKASLEKYAFPKLINEYIFAERMEK